MDTTIEYYNENANEYFNKTISAEMSPVYEHFMKFLRLGSYICDLGCGSGRDSKFFMSQGFSVMPIDGSINMCRLASDYLEKKVACLKFDEFEYENKFDAIWACSSLLHVPKSNLSSIITKLINAAKDNAVIYTCFKVGDSERIKDGRFFADYNQIEVIKVISEHKSLQLLESWISDDVRDATEHYQWLNIIVRVLKENISAPCQGNI